MNEGIYLEVVMPEGEGCAVGEWYIPDERLANSQEQADIGWHIFLSFQKGATEVRVKRSDTVGMDDG